MTTMMILRGPILALGLGLAALPAAAGGFSFDLPRLDFPAPEAPTSRDCAAPILPGAPQPCPAPGR